MVAALIGVGSAGAGVVAMASPGAASVPLTPPRGGGSTSTSGTVVDITPSVESPVFGQAVNFTAAVTYAGAPVNSGKVQWMLDGSDVGPPVGLGADGESTTPALSDLAVGSHTVEVIYYGTSMYPGTTGQTTVLMGRAPTRTLLKVTETHLAAEVEVVAPGAGTPAGTVTFAVGGTTVGSAAMSSSGVATLSYATTSSSRAESATYGGDPDYSGSSVRTPTISATLSSAHPKTRYGWYRSPVTVRFHCAAGTAPLAASCPAAVTLAASKAGQSITRTVRDTDGEMGEVLVSPINIDRKAPQIRVTGATDGATYDAPGPAHLACEARDVLSGLAKPCRLVVHRGPSKVTYTATVTNRAGSTATVKGHYHLLDYFVAGATRSHGRFVVTAGNSYDIAAYLSRAAAHVYTYAVTKGRRGPDVTMRKAEAHVWAAKVTVTKAMANHRYWKLYVVSGASVHVILVTVER